MTPVPLRSSALALALSFLASACAATDVRETKAPPAPAQEQDAAPADQAAADAHFQAGRMAEASALFLETAQADPETALLWERMVECARAAGEGSTRELAGTFEGLISGGATSAALLDTYARLVVEERRGGPQLILQEGPEARRRPDEPPEGGAVHVVGRDAQPAPVVGSADPGVEQQGPHQVQ